MDIFLFTVLRASFFCLAGVGNMRLVLIFVMFVFGIGLYAVPLIVDVTIYFENQINVNWKMVNPLENMKIEIVCLQNENRQQILIEDKYISGDYGFVSTKELYNVKIDPTFLPDSLSIEDIILFPKLLFDSRIYYEMIEIPAGRYHLISEGNIIEPISCRSFYISKFEVTNEQFLSFINYDGYDIEEYWQIAKTIMANPAVGWNYQGKLQMCKPLDWDLMNEPYWKNAESNLTYGPVTNIRWFEANAFCNWINAELPTIKQMQSAFSVCENNASNLFKGIGIYSKSSFPLQNINGGVSEWLRSGVPPMQLSCSAGCNEMFFMGNNGENLDSDFFYEVKCPLYRNPILGFRFIVK